MSCGLLPICWSCERFSNLVAGVGFACDAYPDGIPTDILANVVDHHEPFEGDNGLQFVPKNAEDMQLATDPPVSETQRRAMFAAATGKSNIGIPKSVGEEFANVDPGGKLPEKAKDINQADDMKGGEWKLLRWLLGKFFDEESREAEHQEGNEETGQWPIEDDWSPEAREAAAKARQAKAHLHMTATPRSGSKAAFKTQASSHGEVEQHLFNLHGHIKAKNLEPHHVSIENKHTGETHSAHVSPEGIGKKSYKETSFDSQEPERKGAGIAFMTSDGKALFLKRTKASDRDGEWAFPGGKQEPNEKSQDCAQREAFEEIGDCGFDNIQLMDSRNTNGVNFDTYVVPVKDTFAPKLNDEHSDYKWAYLDEPPDPLHPGVAATLEDLHKRAKDEEGKLSETTREGIGSSGSEKREDMPEGVFLGPHKTYPVKEKRDGEWKYTKNLLIAAAKRARLQGRSDIARRADSIRQREFGNETANDEKLVIEVNDRDKQLGGFLEYVKKTSGIGHSFEVIVDPEDSEYRKKFFFDGDGAFSIKKIEVVPDKEEAKDAIQLHNKDVGNWSKVASQGGGRIESMAPTVKREQPGYGHGGKGQPRQRMWATGQDAAMAMDAIPASCRDTFEIPQ